MQAEGPQRTPEDASNFVADAGGKDNLLPQIVLTYERVTDDRRPQRPTYALFAENTEFGLLQVRRDVKTLKWQGIIDFSRVEEELLRDLPQRVDPTLTKDLSEPDNQEGITALLVLATNKRNSKAHHFEYLLRKKRENKDYHEILKRGTKGTNGTSDIMEIRYDIELADGRCTFVAKNPVFGANVNDNRNLRIKLDTEHFWTPELLEWITAHHVDADILAGKIDLVESASVISNLHRLTDAQGE